MVGFFGERPQERFPIGPYAYDGSNTDQLVKGRDIKKLRLNAAELAQQRRALQHWRNVDARAAAERRARQTVQPTKTT